ncbi:hypothetical protein B2A_03699, partial [mine drainage metagenome]
MTGDRFDLEISGNVLRVSKNETLVKNFEDVAKREKNRFDESEKNSGRGKNFRVTDLINPISAFFDIKNPDLENPSELMSRFIYGKFVERRVEGILSKVREFVVSQGNVDGSKCGLEDVRGRIDLRLGGMIVEVKTSERDIPDVETLLREHPQDLEQLLLYVLFSGREGQDHRLLYLTGVDSQRKARCFKVKIK